VAEEDNADVCHLNNVLNYVFNIIVLHLSLDDVSYIKNVERFKKDIRVIILLVLSLKHTILLYLKGSSSAPFVYKMPDFEVGGWLSLMYNCI